MSAAIDDGLREVCANAAELADGIAIGILQTIETDDPDHIAWSKLKAADDVLQTADRYRTRATPPATETPA